MGDGRNRDRFISLFAIKAHRRFDQRLAGALLLALSKPGADSVQPGRASILHSCKYAAMQHNQEVAGQDAADEGNTRLTGYAALILLGL